MTGDDPQEHAARILDATSLLDQAAALLPWSHRGRRAIRTIVLTLLDEAAAQGPHAFVVPAYGPLCRLCGKGADDHLEHALRANLRVVR